VARTANSWLPFRAALIFAASLIALPSIAAAQISPDSPHVPSPLQSEPDVNGVSLIDGKLDIPMPVVLATPADPRLSFDKVQNSAPYITGSSTGCVGCTLDKSFSVHVGASTSEAFKCTDADCVSVTSTGSELLPAPAHYQRAPGGEIYHFNVVGTNAVSGNTHYYQNYASTVNYQKRQIHCHDANAR
jgi:hypothetical protein